MLCTEPMGWCTIPSSAVSSSQGKRKWTGDWLFKQCQYYIKDSISMITPTFLYDTNLLPKILRAYKPKRRKDLDMHRPGAVVYSCLSDMSLWKQESRTTGRCLEIGRQAQKVVQMVEPVLSKALLSKKDLRGMGWYGSSCASQNSDVVMMSLRSKVQCPPSTPAWHAWEATKSRSTRCRWSESSGSIESTYILGSQGLA